jgi:hypothetical protein
MVVAFSGTFGSSFASLMIPSNSRFMALTLVFPKMGSFAGGMAACAVGCSTKANAAYLVYPLIGKIPDLQHHLVKCYPNCN